MKLVIDGTRYESRGRRADGTPLCIFNCAKHDLATPEEKQLFLAALKARKHALHPPQPSNGYLPQPA